MTALPALGRKLSAVGVQLYTVRDVLPKKPLETLKALDQIGYREAEIILDDTLGQVWDAIKQTSIKPVSMHMDTALFTTKQDKLPAALDDAKSKGLAYVVCPYIAPEDRGGADMMKKLGENLSKAGAECRKRDISLCYHNHAFEFAPVGNSTLLDVMLGATDPKLVYLEMDMMWVTVAGHDPVEILKKYSGRVKLMHLKDVAAMPKRYDENVPKSAFKEVGSGTIHVGQVLAAASKAGVEHYFVEQDETPGDPLASLRKSYEYLSKLDY